MEPGFMVNQWPHIRIGQVRLCQGRWAEAAALCWEAVSSDDGMGSPLWAARARLVLGHVCLRQGDREEAVRLFEEAIPLWGGLARAWAVSGLEAACDDPDLFRARCARLEEERAGTRLTCWFLEPAAVERDWSPAPSVDEPFTGALGSDWAWVDPFGDCAFSTGQGLEIRAANGRDLEGNNESAPRVVREIGGDFAAQAVCVPVADTHPAMGGLVLWKDRENFLRLDVGAGGEREISYRGSVGGAGRMFGRGHLPEAGASAQPGSRARVLLRLERRGNRVRALCSADGDVWFTVGEVEFPVADPIAVGLFAVGMINRTIYPGAYPDGTAIRFESFRLWRGGR
jgi:hypothetical protein